MLLRKRLNIFHHPPCPLKTSTIPFYNELLPLFHLLMIFLGQMYHLANLFIILLPTDFSIRIKIACPSSLSKQTFSRGGKKEAFKDRDSVLFSFFFLDSRVQKLVNECNLFKMFSTTSHLLIHFFYAVLKEVPTARQKISFSDFKLSKLESYFTSVRLPLVSIWQAQKVTLQKLNIKQELRLIDLGGNYGKAQKIFWSLCGELCFTQIMLSLAPCCEILSSATVFRGRMFYLQLQNNDNLLF